MNTKHALRIIKSSPEHDAHHKFQSLGRLLQRNLDSWATNRMLSK
jgi:hypothetical protein